MRKSIKILLWIALTVTVMALMTLPFVRIIVTR